MIALQQSSYSRWYLHIVAGAFAVLCGISSIRYGWIAAVGGGSVPILTQVLCLLFAGAAITYFVRPRVGHHAMLSLSIVVVLMNASTGTAAANAFWFLVCAVLLLPMLSRRSAAS